MNTLISSLLFATATLSTAQMNWPQQQQQQPVNIPMQQYATPMNTMNTMNMGSTTTGCLNPGQTLAGFPNAPFQPDVVSASHCLTLCGSNGMSCNWNAMNNQCVCPPFDISGSSTTMLLQQPTPTPTAPSMWGNMAQNTPIMQVNVPKTCITPGATLAPATGFDRRRITRRQCRNFCDPETGMVCTFARNVCDCGSVGVSQRASRDPLFFDLNKDTFVAAAIGKGGVDINNDTTGDASAVDGDGLLTLYSIDPRDDTPINITGVFGTDTFNPYLNRIIKTPNGFEALFTLAIWAQVKNPDMQIIDNENVYMPNLNDALKLVNYSIGFFTTVGANKKVDIVSLGDVNLVRRRYIARAERSEDFMNKQANNSIYFVEEGRWISSSTGASHLALDLWYSSSALENNVTEIMRFGGEDPNGVFANHYPDVVQAQQMLQTFSIKSSASSVSSQLFFISILFVGALALMF